MQMIVDRPLELPQPPLPNDSPSTRPLPAPEEDPWYKENCYRKDLPPLEHYFEFANGVYTCAHNKCHICTRNKRRQEFRTRTQSKYVTRLARLKFFFCKKGGLTSPQETSGHIHQVFSLQALPPPHGNLQGYQEAPRHPSAPIGQNAISLSRAGLRGELCE